VLRLGRALLEPLPQHLDPHTTHQAEEAVNVEVEKKVRKQRRRKKRASELLDEAEYKLARLEIRMYKEALRKARKRRSTYIV